MKLLRYILFVVVMLAPSSAWAAFVLTSEGTPTGSSGAITSSSFNPGAGGTVYVAVLDVSGVSSPTPPSDGTVTYTSTGNSVVNDWRTYYHYYASSPGTITVSYTIQGGAGFAGMSATLITGSNGVYDTSGSANSGINSGATATVTSNVAAVSGELALGSIFTETSPSPTQPSGWSTPPNAVASSDIFSGNQTLIGTSAVTYSSTGYSGNWLALIDMFEPSSGPPATNHFLPLLGVGQ